MIQFEELLQHLKNEASVGFHTGSRSCVEIESKLYSSWVVQHVEWLQRTDKDTDHICCCERMLQSNIH
jgi:hypothetical protein